MEQVQKISSNVFDSMEKYQNQSNATSVKSDK